MYVLPCVTCAGKARKGLRFCFCVCVYDTICTCMHVSFVCVHARISHVPSHIIYAYTYMCAYIHVHVPSHFIYAVHAVSAHMLHLHAYVHTHTHTHTHICTCKYTLAGSGTLYPRCTQSAHESGFKNTSCPTHS
jgi:hypothetical protein